MKALCHLRFLLCEYIFFPHGFHIEWPFRPDVCVACVAYIFEINKLKSTGQFTSATVACTSQTCGVHVRRITSPRLVISGIASQFAIQNARFVIHNKLMHSKIAYLSTFENFPGVESARQLVSDILPIARGCYK